MNSIRRLLIGCLVLLVIDCSGQSANFPGYTPFGGVNNLDFIPVVAGNAHHSDINIFQASGTHLMSGGQFLPITPTTNFNRNGLNDVTAQFDENLTVNNPASMREHFDVLGPSFYTSLGKPGRANYSIGVISAVRSWMQVDGLNPEIFKWNDNGFGDTSRLAQSVRMDNVAIRRALWTELGLHYSQVVWQKPSHEIAAGGTLRMFQGMNAFYAQFDELNVVRDNTLFTDSVAFQLQSSAGAVFHTDREQLDQSGGNIIRSSNGLSWGGDIGVTYAFKPAYRDAQYLMDDSLHTDQSKVSYLVKVGLAVRNIGSLSFRNGSNAGGFVPSPFTNFNYTFNTSNIDLQDSDNRVNLFDEALQTNRWSPDIAVASDPIGSQTFRMALPTSLQTFVDANLYKGLGATAQMSLMLADENDPQVMSRPNVFQFIPKFETKNVGLYVPMTINQWTGFHLGFGLRAGPFTLGIVDVMALNTSAAYSASQVTLGFRVPILHKRIKDSDLDNYSDAVDPCPQVLGAPSAKGCPDIDGDGVADADDACKDLFGLRETSGCPDDDRDGIINSQDECPKLFGPSEGTPKKGCPDADGDSFIDDGVDDRCPGAAGHVHGCPDSDNDGVWDDVDKCKDNGGKPELLGSDLKEGCPDTDGDGLHDHEDDCDEEQGVFDNNGCPYYDYDGDGVYDHKDRCQTLKGVKENDGCPVHEKIEIRITEKVIYFEEGDALQPAEKKELLKVAEDLLFYLSEDERIIVELIGHTALTETGVDKDALSLSRAQAVKQFLMNEGRVPEFALKTYGRGDLDDPPKVLSYPKGKYPARRVEIVLGIPNPK